MWSWSFLKFDWSAEILKKLLRKIKRGCEKSKGSSEKIKNLDLKRAWLKLIKSRSRKVWGDHKKVGNRDP